MRRIDSAVKKKQIVDRDFLPKNIGQTLAVHHRSFNDTAIGAQFKILRFKQRDFPESHIGHKRFPIVFLRPCDRRSIIDP